MSLGKPVHYVGIDGCMDGIVGSLVDGTETGKVVILLQGATIFPVVRGLHDEQRKEIGTWHWPEVGREKEHP